MKTIYSLDDFKSACTDEEYDIYKELRDIIFTSINHVTEKIAYNVPFYYQHKRICFIWPASIPWGNVQAGVDLGICNANLLAKEWKHHINFGSKSQVATVNLSCGKKFDKDLIRALIMASAELDEDLYRKNLRGKISTRK